MSCHKDEKPLVMTMDTSTDKGPGHPLKIECQHDCERCQKKHRQKKVISIKNPILVTVFLMLSSLRVWAQDTGLTAKTFWDDPINHPLFHIYFICVFVFIVILLTLSVAIIVMKVLNVFVEKAALEKASKLGVSYVAPQHWWMKFWQNANAMVPLAEEKNIELAHNYDGIRELDNHLPPWWKGLFYGTIVFAVVYMLVFHLFDSLPLSEEEYHNEVSLAETQARILKASQPVAVIDENNLNFTNDAAIVARGRLVFMSSNCGSCHRNDGGGNTIGPNLSDAYWLHGGEIKNIFTTIKNGVVEKAMPAWGKVMSQKDVRDVAFYVMSLQGTTLQNAKAPQGELFKPKPDTTARDSTKVSALMNNK